MDRRTFLGAAAAAGLTAFAGCSSAASAAAGPPQVPTDRLEEGGWTRVAEESQDPAYEKSLGPVTITASTVTRLYEDTGLRERVADRTLGQANGQFSTFFATRVTFDPNLAEVPVGRDVVLAEVETEARRSFRERLKAAGLAGIERTGTGTLQVADGTEANLTNYAATYPVDGFSVDLGGGETLTVPGGDLAVDGHLAAWFDDGTVLIAGGAYPGENYDRSVTKTPTSAIEVTVNIDLGLRPDAYREELFGLMKHVS